MRSLNLAICTTLIAACSVKRDTTIDPVAPGVDATPDGAPPPEDSGADVDIVDASLDTSATDSQDANPREAGLDAPDANSDATDDAADDVGEPDGGECGCKGDVSGDGLVDSVDLERVMGCIGHERDGTCYTSDVDCNGQIDLCDQRRLECQFGTEGNPECCLTVGCGACCTTGDCAWLPEPDCVAQCGTFEGDAKNCKEAVCGLWPEAPPRPAECVCNTDADHNGYVNVIDMVYVIDCVGEDPTTGTCMGKDINCTGEIDRCDLEAVRCEFVGGSDCCDTARCGACCRDGECLFGSEGTCASGSGATFLGAGLMCPG